MSDRLLIFKAYVYVCVFLLQIRIMIDLPTKKVCTNSLLSEQINYHRIITQLNICWVFPGCSGIQIYGRVHLLMLLMILIKECIKSSLTKLTSHFFLIFLFIYYSLSFLHLILAKRLKSNTLLFLIENTFFLNKVYSDSGVPSLNFS